MGIHDRIPAKQIRRIKYFFMCVACYLGVQIFTQVVVNAVIEREGFSGPYVYEGVEYAAYQSVYQPQGYIDEYTNKEEFCTSFVVIPGFSLTNELFQGISYLIILCYMFLGIALVADIFMEAIETITSKTTTVTVTTTDGQEISIDKPVWNPTIANLTLMALGSSAPEIILSVSGVLGDLDGVPGELGPMTIVGSAAFNLLVISAVSIMAVTEVKWIFDLRVFAVTAISSTWAYVWFFLVLSVITPDEVTMFEAWLTIGFMVLLLIFAYSADRCTGSVVEKEEKDSEKLKQGKKKRLMELTDTFGKKAIIEVAYQEKMSEMKHKYSLWEMDQKEKGTKTLQSYEEVIQEIQDLLKEMLGVEKVDKSISVDAIMEVLSPENPVERIAFRRQFSKYTTNKQEFVKIKGGLTGQAAIERGQTKNEHPEVGFKHSSYEVSEKNGFVTITIMNKTNKEVNVNLRTEDGQALAGKDYEAKDMILTLKPLERERHINIPVKNDAEWAPDKDFMVLICDESGEKLIGDDCEAKVTILEDDKPGILGFEERQINVSRKQSKVSVKIIRTDGSDGKAKVTIKTIKADEDMVEGKPATADKDYVPFQTQVVLESNVIEYVQDIELPDCENDTTDVYSFAVVLEDPVPAGVKLSKRATCYINIEPAEGNAEIQAENQERDKMLDYFLNNQDPPYSSHFKNACILGPSIDDNNLMDDVTCGEAIMHLLTIFWKCLFAIIPPKNMWGGWAAFLVALSLIGVITVLVGEIATVLGCSIGLKPSVTGITLVAMGTSLPDTFASKTAAQGSQYADSAIGNVTGSNSVNVFLGVGLPWVIGAMYWQLNYGTTYFYPQGSLAFSVVMFLSCSMGCFAVLIIRRIKVGGELGGDGIQRPISAFICFSLWLIYVIMVSLEAYGMIEVEF